MVEELPLKPHDHFIDGESISKNISIFSCPLRFKRLDNVKNCNNLKILV